MVKYYSLGIALAFYCGSLAVAQEGFATGPVLTDFGPVALTEEMMPVPAGTTFNVVFDVSEAAKGDSPARSLVSLARFLNMHVKAGVPAENIHLAVVVHGPLTKQLSSDPGNPNAALLTELMAHGVEVTVCGQSAAYAGVTQQDLLPGITMSLSAMTAHALYQQKGYTLNPF